jgi:hypothetical protein
MTPGPVTSRPVATRQTTLVVRLTFTLLLLVAGGSSARAQQMPQILFAEAPALLVRIEGAPIYRHIADTDLELIVNTRAVIVRDAAGIHYLKALDRWMESYELTGSWSVSGTSPFGENIAIERGVASTADQLDGESAAASKGQIREVTRSGDDEPPTVFISIRPAALIVTDGPPRWQTAAGTSLEYLANTDAKVFREPTDQELYVRVDGAWYRAWTTHGPWQFIPANELPSDIAKQLAR